VRLLLPPSSPWAFCFCFIFVCSLTCGPFSDAAGLAHRSDAVEESLVIISPHGLNPKVKRLVLKPYCLTILVLPLTPTTFIYLLFILLPTYYSQN
jgi:hypothetical protein